MKKIIIILFIFISCKEIAEKKIDIANTKKIDVEVPKELVNVKSLNSMFEMEYISLSNDKIVIGKIDKIIPCNGKLILTDHSLTKSIFIFDENGNFLNKINRLGRGPEEYKDLTNITCDCKNEVLYIWDINSHRILKYRFSGEFINTISIDFDFFDFQILDNNLFYYTSHYYANYKEGHSPNLIYFSDLDGKERTKFLNFTMVENTRVPEARFNNLSINPSSNLSVNLNFNNCDTIFKISPKRVESNYVIDFLGFKKVNFYSKKISPVFNEFKAENKIPRLLSFYETKNSCYFSYSNPTLNEKIEFITNGIYNKRKKKVIRSFISFSSTPDKNGLLFGEIKGSDSNFFYSIIQAADIVEAKEKYKINQKIERISNNITPYDNPIILKFKERE